MKERKREKGRRGAKDAIAERERENGKEGERRRSRRVLAGLKGGWEEREFPLSYIFFLVFSSVPWEKFVV
jgi:hypothetical protein